MDGRHGGLGDAPRPERPEVGRAVVADLADQRQPRERLDGELEPAAAFGEPGAAVVAGLALGDEPQLADLGLERRGALDAGDTGGDGDHLGHPRPGLGRREVGAHAGAHVLALADVEGLAVGCGEQVDAGGVRQLLGQVPLLPLRRGDLALPECELLDGVHAGVAEPLQQPVQDVDRGPGVGEGAVVGRGGRPEQPRQRGQLAVAGLVAREHPAGQPCGVEDLDRRPVVPGQLAGGLQEPDVERRVVGDDDAAAGELEERRQHRADARRPGHHVVGDARQHRDERRDGRARAHQGVELADHLAAADLHRPDLGDLVAVGAAAGGLEVDHDERGGDQRHADLVQRALDGHGRHVPPLPVDSAT